MKKTIAIDLDDVLGNTAESLDKFHNLKYGTSLKLEDHTTYALNELWNCSMDDTKNRIHEFFKSDFGENITLLDGSKDGVLKLSKKYDLIVLTSRPIKFQKITEIWIEKNFPNLFKEVVITNKQYSDSGRSKEKFEICHEKGIDLMIEDHLFYAEQNANNNIFTYLFNKPWNQKNNLHERIKRVYSWKDILNEL